MSDKIATKTSLEGLANVINDKFKEYKPTLNFTLVTTTSANPYTKSSLATALGVTEDDIDIIMSGECLLYDKANSNSIYYPGSASSSGGMDAVDFVHTRVDPDYSRLEVKDIMIACFSGSYIYTYNSYTVALTVAS